MIQPTAPDSLWTMSPQPKQNKIVKEQLGLCLGWKGQLICLEGGGGREGGMGEGGREGGMGEGGVEGGREGGRRGREGGREGGRGGRDDCYTLF